MRVVVTGGAGFLGSHVADVLRAAKHDVTVVDLQPSTGHRSVIADLRDVPSLTAAFADADAVCHLAAVGDVYLAAEKPALAAEVNVVGTANVCEAAVASAVKKIVYASTWEVYGQPKYQPLDEEHPCAPDHPYNITKLAGERIALAYHHLRGLDVTALRLGTAYGTRMRPNSVFSLFIDRASRGEAITIQGTGEQARQFTHARDIGSAFNAALTRGAAGREYNVVAEEFITIRRLAELVTAMIPTKLEFAPARKADVPTAHVSSARARQELGWEPAIPFERGLRELVEARKGAKTV